MAAEYQLICQPTSVGQVLVNMLTDILANSSPRVGRHVSREVSKSYNIWEVAIVKRFTQVWMTNHWKSRCCRKVAIVQSWLLVSCRLDYIIYITRDFKIQRHISNKNIAYKANLCSFSLTQLFLPIYFVNGGKTLLKLNSKGP